MVLKILSLKGSEKAEVRCGKERIPVCGLTFLLCVPFQGFSSSLTSGPSAFHTQPMASIIIFTFRHPNNDPSSLFSAFELPV